MWIRVGALIIVVGFVLDGCASVKEWIRDPSAGRVFALDGVVLVIHPQTSQPESLELNSRVFAGDVVRTV